ncbi:MAG: DUF1573 domain-containing protein [Phycisphaerales bacterium]|nr:DUF1573 domain-containing protein [Phycisphaerales bacterium]
MFKQSPRSTSVPGSLLLALLALLAVACERPPAAQPAVVGNPAVAEPPPTTPPPPATLPPPAAPAAVTDGSPPRLSFETLVHDFGKMPETETRTARLTFANTGGSPLEIQEVKTSCGCTAASLDKETYAPGESGEIAVTFDPSAPGTQRQYVNVFSNSGTGPTRIMIVAEVEGFVLMEPRLLQLGIRTVGQRHEAVVGVSSPDPAFEIRSVRTTNPKVRAEVLDPADPRALPDAGRTVGVTVDPSAPWGSLFSWLEVTVYGRPTPGAAPITHTAKIRVQGELFGALIAKPNAFRFGVRPGADFERSVRLERADGNPFAIVDIKVTSPLAESRVDLKAAGPASYELVLIGRAGDRPRQANGVVRVTTDVEGEETIEIPIVGVVRAKPRGVR